MASIDRLIRRAGGPTAVSTVFDVGAHNGEDSLPIAERYPNVHLVAIEPTPDLAEALRRKSVHLANYTVVEVAVASEEGSRALNAFVEHPELNSLNRLDSSAASVYGLQAAEPDSRQTVSARRLSTICDELGIPTIDVIHIDTQGSDLDVLRSLDESRLQSLRAGAIEASYRLRLYDTSQPGDQIRLALDQMGFRIFRVERLHYAFDWEQDYYFVRSPPHRSHSTILDNVAFRSHLIASEIRSIPGRSAVRPVQRMRVALGIRTRLRSFRQ